MLKALPAQHRPSLRRPERYRSFFPALRTVRPGLSLRVRMPARRPVRRSPNHCHSFALAILAAFGFVLELLVVEEKLFACCEHEIRATIDTLQNLVLVFHWRGAPIPRPCSARETRMGRIRFTSWAGDLHPPHVAPWIRPAMRCTPHGY